MEKQFESTLFDNELKKLESDFVWTSANNPELRAKLIKDMNESHQKLKFTNLFGKALRLCATATVLILVFIIGNQKLTLNHNSGSKGSTDKEEYPYNGSIINNESTITFTVEEQNLIEGINKDSIPLTNESTIIRDLSKELTFINGKPKIEATKNYDGKLLVKVTYPTTQGNAVIVRANENKYSSIQDVKKVLEIKYPDSEKITISNRNAFLYKSLDGRDLELLIIDDKYFYLIEGENNKSFLIQIAEQIKFSN